MAKDDDAHEVVNSALTAILMLDATLEAAKAFTEMRRQFTDQGWTEHGAEMMVHAIYVKSMGG